MDTPTTDRLRMLLPAWFEGHPDSAMLEEALAQCELMETALRGLQPHVNVAFLATPELASGDRFEAIRTANASLDSYSARDKSE